MVTNMGAYVRTDRIDARLRRGGGAAGKSIVVLDKKIGWVRVGSSASEPWGWIHSSPLAAAP